jgi:glutamate/tyrosine decarboxylase-like PLP-dependent enzyme
VTIDPHKAGYIQYPAGAIVFQNKNLRDLLACKAPYITPTADVDDPSVGTYGIDGSRAGAAAAATYLHRVTSLNPDGHGMLIGQVNFTTKIIWALLATMAKDMDPFYISQIHQPKDDAQL